MSIELYFPFACIIMSITQVLVAKEVNKLICSSFQVYLPRCISTYVFLCNASKAYLKKTAPVEHCVCKTCVIGCPTLIGVDFTSQAGPQRVCEGG